MSLSTVIYVIKRHNNHEIFALLPKGDYKMPVMVTPEVSRAVVGELDGDCILTFAELKVLVIKKFRILLKYLLN